MKINKNIKKFYCSDLGNYILEILIIFGIYLLLVDKFSLSNIKVGFDLLIAICYGRIAAGTFDYIVFQKYCRKYKPIEKFMTFGTTGLLIFAIFVIFYIESTRTQTIHSHTSNLTKQELQINLSKPYLPDIKEKRWKPVWKIDIKKDTIKVVNVKKDKIYTFNLSLKNKEYILKLLQQLKKIDSTWDNKYHGKDSWYIEIITDKNYIAFTKFLLNATIDNKKEQKTINELLSFIDKKLKSLHIYKNNE